MITILLKTIIQSFCN